MGFNSRQCGQLAVTDNQIQIKVYIARYGVMAALNVPGHHIIHSQSPRYPKNHKKSTSFTPNTLLSTTSYSLPTPFPPFLGYLKTPEQVPLLPPSFYLSPFRLPMHHRHIFLTSNSMTTFSSPVCVQVSFLFLRHCHRFLLVA
jgi:hypothetical protein